MLASTAVARAYREAAIKAIGTTPTDDENDEGLSRLNGFLFSLFGAEIGENLSDWQVPAAQRTSTAPANNVALPYPANLASTYQQYAPANYPDTDVSNPPPNSRVIWRGAAPTTVYFPEYPADGARMSVADTGATAELTLSGNGRMIGGAASVVLPAPVAAATWFYRADLGNWIPLAALALTDELPLPSEFDDLAITGTAIRLTALDEIDPRSGTMMIHDRLMKRCAERYHQPGTIVYGGEQLRMSGQEYSVYAGRQW